MALKVLRVIRSLDPIGGGPAEGLRQSYFYLLENGLEITVASLDSPQSVFLSRYPFPIIPLGPVLFSYGFRFGLTSRLKSICIDFDVVIIEGLWQYHGFSVFRALSGTPVPYYLFPHGMLDPWFVKAHPIKHFKKLLYWLLIEKRVANYSNAVLFTTYEECVAAKKSPFFFNTANYVVGFGAESPSPISKDAISSYFKLYPQLIGKDIYLFLGRIHPKKGVDLLIKAFAVVAQTNPNSHLVLAGPFDASYGSHLKSCIRSLGLLAHVTWTGLLLDEFKSSAFFTSKLFCLPSHQENYGVAVAEALSYGLPVAISRCVNISSRVALHNAGLVFKDTLESTTNALLYWEQLPPAERQCMSNNALKLFHQELSWQNSASLLSRLLRTDVNSTN